MISLKQFYSPCHIQKTHITLYSIWIRNRNSHIINLLFHTSGYSRFFKLYMYTAVAPVPLSSFAGEGTSQVGRQFLKSYAGVCLQGAVIIIACIIFSVLAETPTVVTGGDATSMVWSWLLQTVFYFLVLVGAVKMSDRVVKEMIGF